MPYNRLPFFYRFTFVGFLAVALCFSGDSMAQTAGERLHEINSELFSEAGFPGMSVSVSVEGVLVYSKGFGYADLEQRVAVSPGVSLFRIGSVSKAMTASAVGQLIENDALDVDRPVQDYVPDFPEKRWPITTRQVAGHIAGIRHYRGMEFFSQRKYRTVSDGLTIFRDDSLMFEPGTDYSYSSYGWNLVSAIVEGASGIEFLSYMADSVFVPYGMIRTTADHNDQIIPYRTRFYIRNASGDLVPAPHVDNSYKWAGGGFLSTTEDLVRFGQAYLDGVFPAEVRDELWTPLSTSDGESTNYGIGWASGTDSNGRRWVGHNGGSVGGTTHFRIFPDQEIVIAVVTNLSGASFGTLSESIVDALMQP